MENTRIYTVGGMTLQIPLMYDEQSRKYIEDYKEYIEKAVFTPEGNRVMFAGEDACRYAKESSSGGCPDCGCCIYYKRAGEHTWIGVCEHPRRKQKRKNE